MSEEDLASSSTMETASHGISESGVQSESPSDPTNGQSAIWKIWRPVENKMARSGNLILRGIAPQQPSVDFDDIDVNDLHLTLKDKHVQEDRKERNRRSAKRSRDRQRQERLNITMRNKELLDEKQMHEHDQKILRGRLSNLKLVWFALEPQCVDGNCIHSGIESISDLSIGNEDWEDAEAVMGKATHKNTVILDEKANLKINQIVAELEKYEAKVTPLSINRFNYQTQDSECLPPSNMHYEVGGNIQSVSSETSRGIQESFQTDFYSTGGIDNLNECEGQFHNESMVGHGEELDDSPGICLDDYEPNVTSSLAPPSAKKIKLGN